MFTTKLKANITLTLSILTLIITIFTFIFGNNIIDRFAGPNVVMTTRKDDFKIPDKLNTFINNNDTKNEIKSLPNIIRVINIKNIGAIPSRNLNIALTMDGEIFQYKLNSTEIINNEKINENSLSFNLERLSKNATISIICWLKDENNSFIGTYADDKNSGKINTISENESNNYLWKIILGIIMAITIIIIIKEFRNKIDTNYREQNKLENILYKHKLINELEDNQYKEEKDEEGIDLEELIRKTKEL